MARKSIRNLRKEAEAAEALGKTTPKKKKAAKKATRTRRTKEKVSQRKRIVWGVFSGSMKEEARFPYDQREAAEEKLEQLKAKTKKMYFIQPIKEVIADAPAPAEAEKAAE